MPAIITPAPVVYCTVYIPLDILNCAVVCLLAFDSLLSSALSLLFMKTLGHTHSIDTHANVEVGMSTCF